AHSFFFFFQAEDGIRDSSVTGVQTCALPISRPHGRLLVGPRVAHLLDLRLVRLGGSADHLMTTEAGLHRRDPRLARDGHRIVTRSEERRVGKEYRLGGWWVCGRKRRLRGGRV